MAAKNGCLPTGWIAARLCDIAKVERGKFTHRPRNAPEYYGGPTPFVQTGDVVGSGRYLRVHSQTLSDKGLSVSKVFPSGTVLMVIAGSVGECTITNFPVAFPDSIVGLRPKSEYSSEFVLHLLRHIRPQIETLATESAQANLSLDLIQSIEINLPPSGIRRQIEQVLDASDSAIERTRDVIAQTRKVKASLLQDLLTNGLPRRHKKYANNKKVGRYPADWRLVPLDDLRDDGRPICYGILMPGRGYPGGVPVVKVKDIRGGQIDESDILLTSPELDEEYRRSRLRTGDLLMTIRGSTGRVAIVPATLDRANITQDTARLSVSDDVTRDFLYYALQGHALQQLVQHHTIGQAVKGINIEEVRKLLIPLPGDDERTQIVELFHRIEERLGSEETVLKRLVDAKSALSQALLTGHVPASTKGDA